MIRMRGGISLRIVLAFCIFMQALMLLPHHHHGDGILCVNPMHCVAAHDVACKSGDGCAPSRHWHDREGSSCCLKHLDVMRPERDKAPALFAAIADPGSLMPPMLTLTAPEAVESGASLTQLKQRHRADAVPFHTDYIVSAIPPRAPSFAVSRA